MSNSISHTPSEHGVTGLRHRMEGWLANALFNTPTVGHYLDPLLEAVNPLWSQSRIQARVVSVDRETHDTLTFTLMPSQRWAGFSAGQHVTIEVEKQGVRQRRTFSLACSPSLWSEHGLIRLTIKQVSDGRITPWLHTHVRAGDFITLGEAFGDFALPDAESGVLYIAGGSGITPILSHLETLAEQGFAQPVSLIYCVRSEQDAIALTRLQQLAQNWPQFSLHLLCSEQAEKAPVLLNAEHLNTWAADAAQRQIYLCGPQGLMDLATELLTGLGASPARITRAHFNPPRRLSASTTGGSVLFSKANVQVETDSQRSLLEVAEAAQLKPRYGCRMGICHQCSCRKSEGVVMNTLTGKLSGPGEEAIQLCVSVPQGPVVIDI